ncbi:hypothetical protein ACFQU9_28175 [Actinomadura namibiensis]|uniref:Uncharacterized protein n=1 Tax=Actinomadura namibiensis TaxID=182080 RepID=A0A7W3QJL4_ACTNM|nr:hypothetical protein [Actinomadura namibiensis]MBA8949496.1 hypothetical protein [Actinomadura namibiensis]
MRANSLAAREIVSALSEAMPSIAHLWARVYDALAVVPRLTTEISRSRAESAALRRRYADLVAAGRATLGAARDAESDPLYYLRDELRTQGHLPPDPWGRS